MNSQEKQFIRAAIDQAKKSIQEGGFPAGAIIVKDGKIISKAISTGYLYHDPSGHAETVAIRDACKILHTANIEGAVLYESIECCVMCFSVAYWAGISKIVYACKKTAEMASKQYYEGITDNEILNKENDRKIELVFASEFEEDSLKIIEDWESQGGFTKK